MENNKKYPFFTDEEFYNLLRSDVLCQSINDKKQMFFDYIKKNIDRKKFFKAIGFDPTQAPDELTVKQAKEALQLNLVSCDIYHKFEGSVDWYSNPTYNKYEEWTWQLSRHRQVLDLSWMYYYTKDEKYAKAAIELLDSWISQATAPPLETDGHTTLCWRTIECGIRMNVWAKVLIMLIDTPYFTPDFCLRFFKSVYEHAERLYHRYTAANWLTIEMNGLYVTALLYPFFKRSDAWRNLAKNTFISQMDEQTLDDGTHYELTFGYQNVALNGFFNALKLGVEFDDKFPKNYYLKFKKQLHTIVSVMMPNGDAPNVNDGKLLDIGNSIKNFAEIFPDDELLRFAKSDNRASLPSPVFTSLLLKNAGFAVFRSSWMRDGIAGFFDGGKFGRCHNHEDVIRCHQHEDKLNFLMYVGDKNVICESESYAYDTSKMRYHALSSEGHNTAIVNGKGQSRLRKNHWDKSMLSTVEDVEFEIRNEIEYAKAKYNEGYGPLGEISATHERTVYFVKNPCLGSPYFVIKDKLIANSVCDFDIIWHYDTEKLLIEDNKATCAELTTFFAGDNGSITVYNGSEQPFAGWKSNSFKQGDFRGIPTVYYKVSGKHVDVVTAFIPCIDGKNYISSVDYLDNVINVRYTNGETLKIDF